MTFYPKCNQLRGRKHFVSFLLMLSSIIIRYLNQNILPILCIWRQREHSFVVFSISRYKQKVIFTNLSTKNVSIGLVVKMCSIFVTIFLMD